MANYYIMAGHFERIGDYRMAAYLRRKARRLAGRRAA